MFPCFVTGVIDMEDSTYQRIGIICLKLEPHLVVGSLKVSTIGNVFPLFCEERLFYDYFARWCMVVECSNFNLIIVLCRFDVRMSSI